MIKTVVKWALIVALFLACQYYAFLQRGYWAVGGEIFIVAAPVWWAIVKALMEHCSEGKERKCEMVFEIGNYRLKPYSNRLCWELFEYREIISNKGANAGSKRIDWVSTGFYPRSFESGLMMIYKRLLMDGKPEPIEGVEAAIKEAKGIEKRLRNEAKKVSNG